MTFIKSIQLLVLFIVILFSCSILSSYSIEENYSPISEIIIPDIIKTDLQPHYPIWIQGDEEFADYDFPVSGTIMDPYLITNLEI